jgi:TPR repeat protein
MRGLKLNERRMLIALIAFAIILLIGLFYVVPSKKSAPLSPIPPITQEKEREEWIIKNADNPKVPYDDLTNRELRSLVSKDSNTFEINKNLYRAYYEFAMRLKREPNEMDGNMFVQQIDDCHYGSSPIRGIPLSCRSPKDQRMEYMGRFLGKAAFAGYFLAEYELIELVYSSPTCCNYDWLVHVNYYINYLPNRKKLIKDDDFFLFFSALQEIKDNKVDTRTLETLRKIALKRTLGDGEAAYELFRIYQKGSGIPRSYSNAYAWLLISHALGYKIASETLSSYESQIDRESVVEGQKIAQELFKKRPSSDR